MPVMALTDSYSVLVALGRAGCALAPDDLAEQLDWPPERVAAALLALAAIRPMPIGCDAEGAYFITRPGRRRLQPFRRAGRDDDDDSDGRDEEADV